MGSYTFDDFKFLSKETVVFSDYYSVTQNIGERFMHDREKYCPSNLNEEQRKIFEHVKNNPGSLTIIQAGPGTGKTFTLLTITHWLNVPKCVIIYKHDLLELFRTSASTMTVAKFMMNLLDVRNLMSFSAIEQQLSSIKSAYEFATNFLALFSTSDLTRVELDFHPDMLIIIDEYTVIPKVYLFLIITILQNYNISVVLCGDKNQLHNIHNSRYTKCSSFDLAEWFRGKVFTLSVNERCKDKTYNGIIEYVSQYSSSERMNEFGYAIMSMVFTNQMFNLPEYNCIHMASTHRQITQMVHSAVLREDVQREMYAIDRSRVRHRAGEEFEFVECVDEKNKDLALKMPNGLYMPYCVQHYINTDDPGKFLPYLPLNLHSWYYVEKHSETCIGQLIKYDSLRRYVVLLMNDGHLLELYPTYNDKALFAEHRTYILGGQKGSVFNYPIYPTNIMSFYKCQGCTICQDISLDMSSATFQGMYVALSRVQSPTQIRRVIIPNMISYIVATIIQVPELIDQQPVTREIVERVMINYEYTKLQEPIQYVDMVSEFIKTDDRARKIEIRDILLNSTRNGKIIIVSPPTPKNTGEMDIILKKLFHYRYMFLCLRKLDQDTRTVWFYEFVRRFDDLILLRDGIINDKYLACRRYFLNLKVVGLGYDTMEFIENCDDLMLERIRNKDPETLKITTRSNKIKYLRNTFLKQVYDRYRDNRDITVFWLMGQLEIEIRGARSVYERLTKTDASRLTNDCINDKLNELFDLWYELPRKHRHEIVRFSKMAPENKRKSETLLETPKIKKINVCTTDDIVKYVNLDEI